MPLATATSAFPNFSFYPKYHDLTHIVLATRFSSELSGYGLAVPGFCILQSFYDI